MSNSSLQPALWVHPSYLVRREGMRPLAIDATLDQIASAQIPLFEFPVSEVVYQTQYLGDGGGGWCDVDKDEYDRDTNRQNYRTRTVLVVNQ